MTNITNNNDYESFERYIICVSHNLKSSKQHLGNARESYFLKGVSNMKKRNSSIANYFILKKTKLKGNWVFALEFLKEI